MRPLLLRCVARRRPSRGRITVGTCPERGTTLSQTSTPAVSIPRITLSRWPGAAPNGGIEDLDRGIAAVSHALRPGGQFVFSILYPCFTGGKNISGSWPATGRYYDEGRWTARGALSTLRRQVGANHRMLSTYLNTLRAHDLWLDQITEPVPAPDWDQAHDADRKPVYLVEQPHLPGCWHIWKDPMSYRTLHPSRSWDQRALALGPCQ